MKVFHVITTIDLGGAEQQLCVLVEEQIRNGIDVEVIPLKGGAELFHKLKTLGAGVNLDFINWSPLRQLWHIRKYFKNNSGIVHAHLPRAEFMAALSKGKNRLIISKHNAENFIPDGNLILSRVLSKVVLRQATDIIAISNAVNDFLINSNELNKNAHLTVIHYGIKKNEWIGSREFKNPFLVGTVSRLVEQKDIPTLLKAFRLVSKEIPDARLQILGVGPLQNQLLDLAADLKITNKVDWLGKSDRVMELMNSWSVFALTSKYEGFGLVLLEAMSARLPIFATNISAIPEVIGEQSNQLFELGDHVGLAERIISTRDLQVRQNILQAQAIRLVQFSAVKMESKVREIYSRFQT